MTKLVSGGKLTEMSTYDVNTSKFRQDVKIQHTDAFTLRPLILTEGPLAGRHVLVLDPITSFFRFMDLPGEIRQIIYDLLLKESEPISITTRKQNYQPRYAQRYVADKSKKSKPGFATTNILDTFLRLSKQVASEAATTFYGNNVFEFDKIANMKIFLTGIGSMHRHLRYLHIARAGYTASKARPTFSLLMVAEGLRTLAFHHDQMCGRTGDVLTRPDKHEVVADLKGLLDYLYGIQRQQKRNGKTDGIDVLSIVKIHWDKECMRCSSPDVTGCEKLPGCGSDCGEHLTHCKELMAEVRSKVAKSLWMEE